MYYYSNRLFYSLSESLNYLKHKKYWNLNLYNCFCLNYKCSRQYISCSIFNGFSHIKTKSFVHTDSTQDFKSHFNANDNINNKNNNEDVTLFDRDNIVHDSDSDSSEIDKVLNLIRNTSPNEMNDYIFETIDKNILPYYDKFTFNDLNTLLQMSLRNFYSQNVIQGLVLKMQSSDPSELSVTTLALLIQNIGRLQPCDLEFDKIKEFFDKSCSYILKLDSLSESNFSSIIYGFQRLHYFNYPFLNKIVKRYNRELIGVNINSLVISFSSIIKLNYFNIGMILGIYSQIAKSIYNMTLQTTIQFINTISKIHEYYNNTNENHKDTNCNKQGEKVTNKKLTKLNKSNYNLMNYMVKNVIDNYSPVVNLVQTSLILNSMNKMGFKKPTYISRLINTLASNNNKTLDENENDSNYVQNESQKDDGNENEEFDVMDLASEDFGSNRDVLVLKSKIDKSLNEMNLRDSKNREKNILNFKEFPECPFIREKTIKKLQGADPNHLILICESLFGLDYYTDYSVNLMFVIKEIISPILHELKANNIMMFLLSFTNLNFTDYQVQGLKFKKNRRKDVNLKDLESLIKSLDNSENYNRDWFEPEKLVSSCGSQISSEQLCGLQSLEKNGEHPINLNNRLRDRLKRSEWKEQLVLNCFENLLRHIHFIKSSGLMMRKFRVLFSLLTSGIYLPNYPVYFKLLEMFEEESKEYNDDRIKSNWIQKFETVPAILPQNIVQNLVDLYLNKDLMNGVSDDGTLNIGKGESDHNENKETNNNGISSYKVGSRTLYVDKDVFGLKIPILITDHD